MAAAWNGYLAVDMMGDSSSNIGARHLKYGTDTPRVCIP